MNDERRGQIAIIKERIRHNRNLVARNAQCLTIAVGEELSNPSYNENVSQTYKRLIDDTELAIERDEHLLDTLEDNEKFIELLGEELHDMYKYATPGLWRSTTIIKGIAGAKIVYHREFAVRNLFDIEALDAEIKQADLNEYHAEYCHWATGTGSRHVGLAFIAEANVLYYWG